jgi:hypothetical protein
MRVRVWLLACVVFVGLVTLWSLEPRLHHDFPSMVDDWSAIAKSPDQLREILRLENPEPQRYRPGFIAWNALQWHTLDAPTGFVGPQFWGVLRWALLVVGLTLLAALLVVREPRRDGFDRRWLLVAGVALVVLTPASLVIDVARFGPQEPLLVGCMSLGAVLLVRSLDLLLGADRPGLAVATALPGLALWSFGVLQKETSICVLLLAPFLLPTIRSQTARWERLSSVWRTAVGLIGAGILLPFVPMVARTIQLARAEDRLYEEVAAAKSFVDRLSDQLERAGEVLHTPAPTILAVAAIALLAVSIVKAGVDWLSVGFLLVALAFVVFAAEAGVVASRYYLPAIALAALALARSAVSLGNAAVVVTGMALVGAGLAQAWDARGWVEWWVDGENAQEALVREAEARSAGGCRVAVTGLNVEFVQALPVLMRLADEPARDCAPGERFVVVIDRGGPGDETPADHPVLAACMPEAKPIWSSEIGEIRRCTA